MGDRQARDGGFGVVEGGRRGGGSRRLGFRSFILVHAFEVEIISATVWAGGEGIVSLQLVLAGTEKALQGGHDHGALGGRV